MPVNTYQIVIEQPIPRAFLGQTNLNTKLPGTNYVLYLGKHEIKAEAHI